MKVRSRILKPTTKVMLFLRSLTFRSMLGFSAFPTGPNRAKLISDLKANQSGINVLIVSYETLTADYKRNGEVTVKSTGEPYPTLLDVEFYRMILDEAHTVRNSSSKAFKAVMSIQTTKKLCLTGTPFVNRPGKYPDHTLNQRVFQFVAYPVELDVFNEQMTFIHFLR